MTKFKTDVPGWMTEVDLNVLYKLASMVPDEGSILELGCFLGRSTSALFNGKSSTVKLTVVDSFEPLTMYSPQVDIFQIRINETHGGKYVDAYGSRELYAAAQELTKLTGNWLAGFRHCVGDDIFTNIDLHQAYSADFKLDENGYNLAFIDASHVKEDVVNDISKFINNNKTLIVGDDFDPKHMNGVISALVEVRKRNKHLLIVPENSKLWMLVPMEGYWKEQFRNTNSCFFD